MATRAAAKILIVEDDPRVSSLLRESLGPEYEVEVVVDGESAMERANRERPDVVLLDINLPGVSGLEVLRLLRLRHPGLPVIMITGTTDEVAVTTALMRGAFAYLPKPFHLDYVKHLIAAARPRD
jgi:DNA-binding response OmpR family regulator